MKKIGEYACFSLEGTMHPNEDRWVALQEWEYEKDKEHYVNGGREKIEEGEDTPSEGESDDKVCRPSYFAMYDGHGGNMAVEYIIGTLHKHIINADTRSLFYLTEDQPVNEEGISEAIKKGFEKTEAEVLKYTLDHKDASGSCAVVAIVVKSTLFVANVGDSRAVLGRRKPGTSSPWADKSAGFIDKLLASYKPIGMTLDQKATTPSEKKRMIQAGGWLFQGRVWGNLAVARSFGDRTLKGPAYTKAFSPESIKKRKANALRREALAQQQQQQGGAEGGTATNSKTGSPVSSRKEREEKKKRNKAKDSPGSGVKIETETAAEDLQEKEKEKEKKRKKKKKQQQEEEEDNSEDEEVRLAIKKEKERLRTETVIIEEDDESLVKESLKLATSQKKKITTATSAEGSEEVVTKKKKSKSKLTVETNESEAVTPKSPRKASKENNISNNEEEIKKEDNEQQQHKEEDTTATTATTEPTELTEREKKRIARRAEALAKEQEKLLKIQERVLEKRRKLMEKRNTKIQLLVAQKGPSKAGVIIAEPVIKVYHFHPKDDFIVMATDGLWDVVDNNQVVTIIGKRLLKQKSFSAYGLPPPKLVDTCRSICNRARDKHSYDDITTLIFTLKDKDDNNTTNTLTSPSTPSLPSTDSEDELKDSEEEVEEEVAEEDEDEETSTDSSE